MKAQLFLAPHCPLVFMGFTAGAHDRAKLNDHVTDCIFILHMDVAMENKICDLYYDRYLMYIFLLHFYIVYMLYKATFNFGCRFDFMLSRSRWGHGPSTTCLAPDTKDYYSYCCLAAIDTLHSWCFIFAECLQKTIMIVYMAIVCRYYYLDADTSFQCWSIRFSMVTVQACSYSGQTWCRFSWRGFPGRCVLVICVCISVEIMQAR